MSFRLWALKLDLMLRLRGGRLELDAPYGAQLDEWPRIRAVRRGSGPGVLRLKVGRNVWFGHGVLIEVWASGGSNELALGDNTQVWDGVRFQLRHGSIVTGDSGQFREFVLAKSSGELILKDLSAIGMGSAIHCAERVVFEYDVTIGEYTSILDSDHTFAKSGFKLNAPIISEPVVVGPHAFVGVHCVLMRGVRIGEWAIVASGAVVRRGDYPSRWFVAGVPAKAVRSLAGEDEPEPAPA